MLIAYEDLYRPEDDHGHARGQEREKGFSFGRQEHKMGQKGCPASELIFEDCFVPDENVCFDAEPDAGRMKGSAEHGPACRSSTSWSPTSRAGVRASGPGWREAPTRRRSGSRARREVDGQAAHQPRVGAVHAGGDVQERGARQAHLRGEQPRQRPLRDVQGPAVEAALLLHEVHAPVGDRQGHPPLLDLPARDLAVPEDICSTGRRTPRLAVHVGLGVTRQVHRHRRRDEELPAGARADGPGGPPARPGGGEAPARLEAAADIRGDQPAQPA